MGCLCSCKPSLYYYYQIYGTQPANGTEMDQMSYEDDNCIISYDFWSPNGNIGFIFHNKTNDNIYLNKEECFFIRNGFAYNYYQSRSYSYSKSIGKSNTAGIGTSLSASASLTGSETGFNYANNIQTNSNSISLAKGVNKSASSSVTISSSEEISYDEEKIIIIPPKTSKRITEYNITPGLYTGCDLPLYNMKAKAQNNYPSFGRRMTSQPTESNKNSYLVFTEEDSPLVFGNRISYLVENSIEKVQIENMFYVSMISNFNEKEIVIEGAVDNCHDERTFYPKVKIFKDGFISTNRFYIPYEKSVR